MNPPPPTPSPTPEDQREECTNCMYAVLQDTGWSNWTVEGTEFHCAKHLHPSEGFDVFYGTDPGLKYAAECNGFEAGEAVNLDVDGEVELDDAQRAIVAMWEAS